MFTRIIYIVQRIKSILNGFISFRIIRRDFFFSGGDVNNYKQISIGRRVHINSNIWFNMMSEDARLEIEDDVYIGRFVQINCMRCVHIGKGVMLADRVYLADNTHRFSDRES